MTRLPFCSTPGIVPDSSSGAAFDRANTWLNHCLKNHASCATDTDGTSEHTPRRLLKVPQMEQPEQERVLLVEDPPKGVPYAALSYCWGSEPTGVIRTLRANKATHATAGIPLRSLPKTIQDAVLVCARLGLAYVWIDALCIVQDDAADWDREARLMKTVYRGSRLTVAAHAAKSCRDGLGKPAVRPPAPSVLDTRGWTLQEALLPRRTLHFTGREMAWECDEAHLCECGHVEGLMFGEAYPMVRTEWRRNASAPRGGASGDGGWVTLVKRYSRRQLTRGSDKLIAIAGIAELVENMKRAADSEEAYWAGIFRSGLPAQLLWAVQDEDELRSRGIGVPSIRPQPYRAPTWSWASVDGPV
ncbi:heterokaryon incompatibility protein-domain-containing protein, partial [Lasiosphaeris hirsuta]